MQNKILVILGMHRSGTSVTAQWLQKCGLNLGDQLHGADIGNPEGHFEDVDFLRLHEEILIHHDENVVGLTDHPLNEIDGEFVEKINELVFHKNKLHREWGWKEPRTCLFLDHYRRILCNLKYIVVTRDYNDVVSSLVIRDLKGWRNSLFYTTSFNSSLESFIYRKIWNLTKYKKNLFVFLSRYADQYIKVWICYNEELLKHINYVGKQNVLVCNLSTLMQHSRGIFSHIKDDWHFDIDYYNFDSVYKKELVSDHVDISSFIKDKALLEKANDLQRELKKHLLSYSGTKQSLI